MARASPRSATCCECTSTPPSPGGLSSGRILPIWTHGDWGARGRIGSQADRGGIVVIVYVSCVAGGQADLSRHLQAILELVRTHDVLRTQDNKKALVRASQIVRSGPRKADWDKEVAQQFGKVLRQMTTVMSLLQGMGDAMAGRGLG